MDKYSKTLVLDSSYIPRSIISSLRSFVIVYKGNASIVQNHDATFNMCDPTVILHKPSIIRVPKYVNTRHVSVPLTRDNVFKRDEWTCVYCGQTNRKVLTLDHVIPQSKGGPNSWENLVTACRKCNGEKADLSLEEYGKEIPNPKRPHYLMLMKTIDHIPEEWKDYLFIGK
jgi:hypothetical protein